MIILITFNLFNINSTKTIIFIIDMRKLLVNRSASSTFSTLSSIIKNKDQQIKSYDRIKGIQFEKHLKNLMLDSKAQAKKVQQLQKQYNRLSLTSGKPIETILKQFLTHSKSYNENDIVQTTVSLGKIYQMALTDHAGHLDRFGYKLLQSPMFDHFIEQVKYSLTENVYIQNKNIVKVLDALGQMNYVDIEIIKLVMMKIEDLFKLDKEVRIKSKPRAHQIEKKGYYKGRLIGFDKSILQNETFKQNLDYYEERGKRNLQKRRIQGQQLKALAQIKKQLLQKTQKTQKQAEVNEFIDNVLQLMTQFNKFQHGTEEMIQSLLAIRQQYRKLVTISDGDLVIRNPQLNHFALLVEEKLLQLNIISFADISEQKFDEQEQYRRVQEIFKYLMSKQNDINLQDYLIEKEDEDGMNFKLSEEKTNSDLADLVEALARYSNLPYRLEGTDDKTSMININWQRYFIEQNESKYKQNNLQVERIFRRSFAETYIFIKRNLPSILLSILYGRLKQKIKCYSALLEMGFYAQTYSQLKLIKIQRQELQQLSNSQLFNLTKLLNNFISHNDTTSDKGQNIFNSATVYSVICNRLQNIVSNHAYLLSPSRLCDIINYLYQYESINNIKKQQKNVALHRNLVKIMEEQVKYLEHNHKTSKYLTNQAKKILFFQSERGLNSGSLAQLQQFQQWSEKGGNPFIKALVQSLNTQSQAIKLPFIITGVNENNEQTAIYLADSDNCSFSGQFASGNVIAYCQRVFDKFGIRVQPIPINRLINIEYKQNRFMTLSAQSTIKIKDSNQVYSIISEKLPETNQKFISFIRKLSLGVAQIGESDHLRLKAHKILSSINKLLEMFGEQKKFVFINQFYAKRAELLVQFNLLKRDINLLTQEQKKSLEKLISSGKQEIKLENLLDDTIKELSKPLANFGNKNTQKSKQTFEGKRLTLNLIQEKVQSSNNQLKFENPEQQFLNISYLLDNRYIEYGDWRTEIKEKINYNQIKLEEASDLTKILIMKYCPNVRQTIVVSGQDDMGLPFYPLNWQKKHYYHSQNIEQKDRLQQITEQYRQAFRNKSKSSDNKIIKDILNLQNLKHQMKLNKQPREILQSIVNLPFIDNLLESKLQEQSGKIKTNYQEPKLIPRDSKQYFLYLEHKYDKMYLQSPFLEYIINKIQKSEDLKQKIRDRKNNKLKLKIMYQQGSINRKQYFDAVKQLDQKLIEHMKSLKNKLLAHVDGLTILEDSSKIVQLNHHIQDLEHSLRSAFYYDHKEDYDYILSNGNYDEALKIKRWRAQNNLILFRILYKKSTNVAISSKQQQFLQNWKKSVIQGIQKPVIGNQFTNLQIREFKNIGILKNSDIAVSDLILEISHFLDGQLITRLENKIYGQYFAGKLQVPSQIFSTSSNKVLKYYNSKYEGAIFDNNAQLNEKQIQCLLDLSKILKTQGVSDRARYEKHYRDLEQNLQKMNKCRYRNPLIAQYLKIKDQQYYKNYIPSYSEQAKRKEVQKIWKLVFYKQIKQTSKTEISQKINQLCQNMLYLKMNTPPFFGYLVLQLLKHPQTYINLKQKLIANIELFKVPLEIDSQQLLKLVQPEQISMKDIMGNMKKVHNQNFSSQLLKYL